MCVLYIRITKIALRNIVTLKNVSRKSIHHRLFAFNRSIISLSHADFSKTPFILRVCCRQQSRVEEIIKNVISKPNLCLKSYQRITLSRPLKKSRSRTLGSSVRTVCQGRNIECVWQTFKLINSELTQYPAIVFKTLSLSTQINIVSSGANNS